jgi:tetratricopeptide (TPR) repeat protein
MSLAPVTELAFHFVRSGDVEQGYFYALQAGDRAMQTYAYEEALAYYTTAHDLLDPGIDRRPWVLLSIGEVALPAGRADEAAAAFHGARGALLSVDPAAAARANHGLGVTRWRQDRLDEARVALEAALTLLGAEQRPETIRVLIDLATVLGVALGRQGEAMAHAHRALEDAQRSVAGQRARNEPSEYRGLEAIAAVTMGKLLMRGNDLTRGI